VEYFESLRVFLYVVETRSFRRASEMLGFAPPVVSRAIAALEHRLGSRLFHRTTRSVSLTEAGERFYEGCARILDDFEMLEADLSAQKREPSGVLRLVAHTSATMTRLVPLVSSFLLKHPKVGVDLTLTETPVDLITEGYDVGIVLPFMLDTISTVTRLLEKIQLLIVAPPQYLERHSEPVHPSSLASHTFVAMSPSLRKPVLTFRLSDIDSAGSHLSIPLKYAVASNSVTFNRDMVLRGYGIGIVPTALANDELASGQLVRLLKDFKVVDDTVELRIAYNSHSMVPPKARAFVDLAAQFFEETANRLPSIESRI
jgi:DNA-binding transcriptional LysR family regulator